MSRPCAAPPEGTTPGSLHWLHRPTGEPHWMVATWMGDAWNLMDGKRFARPDGLVWWHYAGPATPPMPPGAPALDAAPLSAVGRALRIAIGALQRTAEGTDATVEQIRSAVALDRIRALAPDAFPSDGASHANRST